jgi:hypothetical protein
VYLVLVIYFVVVLFLCFDFEAVDVFICVVRVF